MSRWSPHPLTLRQAQYALAVARLGSFRKAADACTLRSGVIPTVAPYLLPEIAPLLRRRFPRLQLLWVEEKTSALLAHLQAGTLDAALVALDDALADL